MNGDELMFPGPISQLETDRWIQNMEDHMKNNTIAGKDMTQHAFSVLKEVQLLGGGCAKPSMDGKE
jgi:hypothetical protein